MKCFFHSADLDGKCSAAIVKYKFPDCQLIGIDYGDKFPWEIIEKNEIIYMVDFTLQPNEQMKKLNEMCDLIWIDHHITAIKSIEELGLAIKGIRDIKKAGCELTWEYLFPEEALPRSVKLLGRYDVWDHSDSDTLPFQYGMRLFNTDPNNQVFWEKVFNDIIYCDGILDRGRAIFDYVKRSNKEKCKVLCHEFKFEGLRFIAANAALTGSQLFDSVYNPEKHDAMMVYYHKNGKFWTISLYSVKPEVDVSLIAKKYGGGGHKGASGFQVDDINKIWRL